MTSVVIKKSKRLISSIQISGHALNSKYGKDIVCAGISSVVIGSCNALEELSTYDENQIIFQEGLIEIPNLLQDETVQLICEVMIVQLKTIENTYPNYIEISIQQEV